MMDLGSTAGEAGGEEGDRGRLAREEERLLAVEVGAGASAAGERERVRRCDFLGGAGSAMSDGGAEGGLERDDDFSDRVGEERRR